MRLLLPQESRRSLRCRACALRGNSIEQLQRALGVATELRRVATRSVRRRSAKTRVAAPRDPRTRLPISCSTRAVLPMFRGRESCGAPTTIRTFLRRSPASQHGCMSWPRHIHDSPLRGQRRHAPRVRPLCEVDAFVKAGCCSSNARSVGRTTCAGLQLDACRSHFNRQGHMPHAGYGHGPAVCCSEADGAWWAGARAVSGLFLGCAYHSLRRCHAARNSPPP